MAQVIVDPSSEALLTYCTSNLMDVLEKTLNCIIQLWPHGTYQLVQSVLEIGFALAKKVG